jgi:ankyrin repeat protein
MIDVFKYLIEIGADVFAINNNKDNCFSFTKNNRQQYLVIDYLKQLRKSINKIGDIDAILEKNKHLEDLCRDRDAILARNKYLEDELHRLRTLEEKFAVLTKN